MPAIRVVRPISGAPDLATLEAWHALTVARAFCGVGDELGARLRDLGYEVTEIEQPRAPEPAPELRGKNLLAQHGHGEIPAEARALADILADLAHEHGEISFVARDEAIVRAVFTRALTDGIEVEVVIGRAPRGHTLLDLVKVMARLRGPGGCPWDAEQTHQTLAKHLLDETYELLDAIESGTAKDIAEELGDLLLQVVFHAQMGSDAGTFDIDDVATTLEAKLIRRHPHVFGDVEVSGAREVVANWDQIKQEEKQRDSAVEGIPDSLPALAYAQKLQRRAGASGFEWRDTASALRKVIEEAEELARADDKEAEFGDLLFSLVALGRRLDLDAETALRRAARTFKRRFEHVESAARARGVTLADLDEPELLRMWEEAKRG